MEKQKMNMEKIEARSAVVSTQPEDASLDYVGEAKLLFSIALPTVATQFSIYFIYPMTASSVGRNLGTDKLASLSLAMLTGNLVCLSIIIGVLTAADTLMPRAFGAGRYIELGRLAIRGFAVCTLILFVPVVLLLFGTETIFEKLGQDLFVSELASSWLRIYVIGVPFMLLFRIIQRFLAAQYIVLPMVYAASFGCFVVHPLLLYYTIPGLGFEGSALAVALTQCSQVMLVLLYLKVRPVYHPDTWQGLSLSVFLEAIKPEPMMHFWKLSIGGVLSMSEWWFWETVCFMAGHLGVIPLCIHTIAYHVVPVAFMIPLGLSIGLNVRMGTLLANGNVQGAKLIAVLCMGFTFIVACAVALALYYFRDLVVALFTSDEQVQKGCAEIWPMLCVYIVLMYIFGINSGIMRALGLQWHMAAVICSILWCMALPTLLYVILRRGGGITSMWSILPFFYSAINVLLIICYSTTDWRVVCNGIQERPEKARRASLMVTEQTPLVKQNVT